MFNQARACINVGPLSQFHCSGVLLRSANGMGKQTINLSYHQSIAIACELSRRHSIVATLLVRYGEPLAAVSPSCCGMVAVVAQQDTHTHNSAFGIAAKPTGAAVCCYQPESAIVQILIESALSASQFFQ